MKLEKCIRNIEFKREVAFESFLIILNRYINIYMELELFSTKKDETYISDSVSFAVVYWYS